MTCKVCKVGLALEVQKPVTAMRSRTDAGAAFTRKLHTAAPSCLRNASLGACSGQQSLLETELLKSSIQAFKRNRGGTDLPRPGSSGYYSAAGPVRSL